MNDPTAAAARARSAARVLVPAGVVELICLASAGWWPGGAPPAALATLLAAAFVAYAWAALQVKDLRGGHGLVWLFAIAMRLALLPLVPALSHDVYRYLWDGHVQLSGFNPFRYVPADAALAGLRTEWFARIPDPSSVSAHPPVAQLAFLLLAMVGGAVLQAKLLWLALDLTTAWALGRVAAFTGRSRRLTQLLYLWSPLLLVEVAWSAHLTPLALLGIVLVVLLARAPASAGAAAAVAALASWTPAAAVVPLTARLGRRFLFGFLGAATVLALPYLLAGRHIFGGVATFVAEARFLEGPFLLVESVVPGSTAPRLAAMAVVLLVVVWTAIHRYRPERALFWTLGAALLVTPALRPWHVLWILPLAALRASRAWLLFSGLVLLAYTGAEAFRETGVWPQPLWVRLAIWLPFLAMLAREAMQEWRARVPPPAVTAPG